MPKRKAEVLDEPCPMQIDDVYLEPKRKKRKTYIPKCLKKTVWDKWIGLKTGQTKCSVCEFTDIFQIDFHCGHIISEADGGETNTDNLMPICAQCNLSMGRKNLHNFKKTFFKKQEKVVIE
jgi:5-methylcytosine-specific restriction endonuclease McrA